MDGILIIEIYMLLLDNSEHLQMKADDLESHSRSGESDFMNVIQPGAKHYVNNTVILHVVVPLLVFLQNYRLQMIYLELQL